MRLSNRSQHLFQFAVVFAWVGGVASAELAPADQAWVEDNLARVYKTHPHSNPEAELLYYLGGKGPEPVGLKFEIPLPLAEKVFAGFKFLVENQLVLVQEGLISDFERSTRQLKKFPDPPGIPERNGVMPQTLFRQLYRGPLTEREPWAHERFGMYKYHGKRLFLPVDYAELLSFLEFQHRYDARRRGWVLKSFPESEENHVYLYTEKVLRELSEYDPFYVYGPTIRDFISANLQDVLRMGEIDPDSGLQIPSVEKNVRMAISLYHLRLLHERVLGDLRVDRAEIPIRVREEVLRHLGPEGEEKAALYRAELPILTKILPLRSGYFSLRLNPK